MHMVIMDGSSQSPVNAINKGLELARAEFIGVMVDGARMLSPNLLNQACNASRLHKRAVVGTFGFHLGPDVQMRSVAQGYNCQEEDRLLESCGWESDGYRLFNIATFAGASSQGWFAVPNESNALFMNRKQWIELDGYDSNFVSPVLLGEATFHQVHGGVATNATVSKRDIFLEEYANIRGHQRRKLDVDTQLFGSFHPSILKSLDHSIEKASRRAARQKVAA